MSALRIPVKLTLLVVCTVPLYVGWVLTRPLAWVMPKSDRWLQRIWVGTWARASLRILGVRARYEGPIPDGSYFLVANHLSYVDIPLLLARLDARFLAKAEIAGWPIMGFLARTTGTLFIDRTRKRDLTRAISEVKRVLDRGPGVIVFPEGTSTDGSAVEPFKPSLFEVPVEVDVPVRCAALHYDAPQGPKPAWEAVCWWGDATFAPHFLQFLRQGRTEATVTFSAEIPVPPPGAGPSRRKQLSLAAREAVERCFTPSRTGILSTEPSPPRGPADDAPPTDADSTGSTAPTAHDAVGTPQPRSPQDGTDRTAQPTTSP